MCDCGSANCEYEKLDKESDKIRKKIDDNLKIFMTTISDEYQDICDYINQLIEIEIEMEKLCNA